MTDREEQCHEVVILSCFSLKIKQTQDKFSKELSAISELESRSLLSILSRSENSCFHR